ncbi:hypothetical protein Hamer_G016686 [Homarus americanus]|uniref:Tc1-like transposase DDE domain-containing protein n=1 Tax=Homarus americanus TaxID=6706 RepID=A0A8J5NDP6_HOMAM|nr:hypothetical protein Hamer_G016686 [Homarus americanus]
MHAGGVGQLAYVGPGRFIGQNYVEILEEVLLPSVGSLLFPEAEHFYFVRDNSPIHTRRAVQACIRGVGRAGRRRATGRGLTSTLVASMPRCLSEVIVAVGGYTRY